MSAKVKSFDGINISDEVVADNRLSIPSKTVAPAVAVAGSLYYNSTTDQLFRSDGIQWILIQDGVNALGPKYERNITVAQSGADHTTIEAALAEALTLSPVAGNFVRITIYPGTYDLPSNQTVRPFVSLFGIGDVFVDKTVGGGASDHYFSMIGNAQLSGLQFISTGATNAVCIRYSNSNNMIRNCTFRGMETFMRDSTIFSELFLENVKFNILPPTVAGVLSTFNNSTLRISSLRTDLPSATCTIFTLSGTSNTLIVNDIYCESGVDKIFDLTNTTGTITGGRMVDAINTAMEINSGTNVLVSGISFDNNGFDLDLVNGSITLSACEADFSRIRFGGGELKGMFQNMIEDEYAVKTVESIHSGDVLTPVSSSFGGGNATINGMRIFHCQATGPLDNGSGFVEITANVQFGGSGIDNIFSSNVANECLLIGCERGQFSGIFTDLATSPLPLGLVDEVVVEYYGSGQFNETTTMLTEAISPYNSRANFRFFANTNQHRFGYSPTDQSLVTINSVSAYWMRFRIISPLAANANVRQIKIHPPSRLEINSDGFTETYSDNSIQVQELKINSDGTGLITSRQALFVEQAFQITLVRNRFPPSVDTTCDFMMVCPDNINTAKQLTINVKFMGDTNVAGDVIFNLKAAFVSNFNQDATTSEIFSVSGSAPAISAGRLFNNNSPPFNIANNESNKLFMQEFSFDIDPVKCRDTLFGAQVFVFNFSRLGTDVADTYTDDINVLAVEARYNIWHY